MVTLNDPEPVWALREGKPFPLYPLIETITIELALTDELLTVNWCAALATAVAPCVIITPVCVVVVTAVVIFVD